MEDAWDVAADVIVVGYGLAGAIAAVAAHNAGAKVTILEKMPHYGGISIFCGGGVKIANDVEKALTYLKRTNGGTAPEDVLRVLAEGLVWLPDYVEELARVNGAKVEVNHGAGGTYPFPGTEALGTLRVTEVPGFKSFSWLRGYTYGMYLFKVCVDNVEAKGIEAILSTPAKRLLTSPTKGVIGVEAEKEGRTVRIKARRAAVLAPGGFEFNEEMKGHFLEAQPVYGVCGIGNTGDGIGMAVQAGAALWHMWHIHGSYGFRFPGYPIAFRHTFSGKRNPKRIMPWVIVDRFGKRFMNEYPPAPQDTAARPLQYYDPDLQGYPRIPCYPIFDEKGRVLGPIANPKTEFQEHIYEWSKDNSKEVERGWIVRANSLSELASRIRVDPDALEETVSRWNQNCKKGADLDFSRPASTMMSIDTPPYYGVEAWPVVSNTQGGPVHNAEQQAMNTYGGAIKRLYTAGELGSVFGHLYLLGGNIAECFITGRIAGANAAREDPWD